MDKEIRDLSPDSHELALSAARGSSLAFDALAEYYSPRLVSLLTNRHGGNRADAEDVVQNALTRAYEKLSTFDPKYSFQSWLYTIAFRISTDLLRKQKSQRQVSLEMIDAPGRESCPAEKVAACELDDNLWQLARGVLSDSQFTALWLSVVDDLSIPEIARILHKSSLTTRVTLHRAKKILMPHAIRLIRGGCDKDVPSASILQERAI